MKTLFARIQPVDLLLSIIALQAILNGYTYLAVYSELNQSDPDFNLETVFSNGLMRLEIATTLLYFLWTLGLYFYSRKNQVHACMLFFLSHLCLTVLFAIQSFDLYLLYHLFILLLSYLANLKAHQIRREEEVPVVNSQ